MTGRLVVGGVYPDIAARLATQTPHLVFTHDYAQLGIFLRRPTRDELRGFTDADIRLALITGDHSLVLGFKLGSQRWWDAPWQAVRQTVVPPGLPHAAPGGAVELRMALVDSTGGTVAALRRIGIPTRLAQALRTNIEHQLAHAADSGAGDIEIDTWYSRYATPTDLVSQRADLVVRAAPPPPPEPAPRPGTPRPDEPA